MNISIRRAALAALIVPAASAFGAGFTFTKVADTSTPSPVGGGNLSTFSQPTVSAAGVAFQALRIGDGATGIYFASDTGGITRAVDTNTPIPGGTGNFRHFNGFAQDGDVTVFTGMDDTVSQAGIFRVSDGSMAAVVRKGDVVPASVPMQSVTLGTILVPSADNGHIAFNGFFSSSAGDGQGIFSTLGGSIAPIVDSFMTAPGTLHRFTSFGPPQLRGDKATFRASYHDGTRKPGIYLTDGASDIYRVAEVGMARPNGGVFVNFSSLIGFDGSTIAFVNDDGGVRNGVFASVGGTLTTVADTTTMVPGGNGETFSGFGDFTGVDSGAVVFYGVVNAGASDGVYLWRNGTIEEVLSIGDLVDGKTVTALSYGYARPMDGGRLALSLSFSDNTRGVYVATVPEPSAIFAPLVLAGLNVLRRRR